MILRALAMIALLYALGFALFTVTLGTPAPEDSKTEAIVVLTGGKGRIERAVDMLADGRAERLLISVAGHEPYAGELVTAQPSPRLFGVGSGIDRFRS